MLAVWAALAFTLACGDGEETPVDTPTPRAPTASAAVQIIPDLSPLGFQPSANQLPGLSGNDAATVALFENPTGKVTSLRFEITIAANAQEATNRFNAFARALENPPPGLFGADTKQVAGTPAFRGDQAQSYKTDKPDGKGTLVFTDLHRFGRAVVVFYTIGPDTEDTVAIRKSVAEQMAQRAPR